MKLQYGSVTDTDSVTVYIRWAYCLLRAKVEAFEGKKKHKTPYHDLSFLWRKTLQQRLRTQRNLKNPCATE
jgi:hypothetical protein